MQGALRGECAWTAMKGPTLTKAPLSVTLASIFLVLNALIWLAFGVIITGGLHPAMPDTGLVRWGMGGLSLLAGGVLIGLWVLLRKRSAPAYYLTVAALVAFALVTVFDDFGLSDLIVELVVLIPLALLLKDRRWYLGAGAGEPRLD